jgi:hypothetical protein
MSLSKRHSEKRAFLLVTIRPIIRSQIRLPEPVVSTLPNFSRRQIKWLPLLLLATTAGFGSQMASAQSPVGTAGGGFTSPSIGGSSFLAQATPSPTTVAPILNAVDSGARSTTILPTDVLPLPTIQNRMTFGENFQLRVLQKLPARFYFTSSTEISLRYESNPFQFPTKRRFIRELGPTFTNFQFLNPESQQAINHQLALPGAEQTIFRVLPNVTAGYTLTPHTRLFTTYFMIRDSLCVSTKLNTTINSIAYGLQQDVPLGTRANLQGEIQFRELYQAHQKPVFDFLPGLTVSYVVTPRTVAFVNALLQMRGIDYYRAPTRELDPFYTWGFLHQRGGWSFSASTTFVQNFREHFKNSQIKQDNYAFISDFEVARRLFRQIPGIQAFVRAEPIWNFHSRYRPGLAGMDFRLFYGLRMAVSKPALTSALDSLRRQLEEQEIPGPSPGQGPKPSAFLQPHEVIAATPQPIHGFLTEPVSLASTESGGTSQLVSMHSEQPEGGRAVLPTVTANESSPLVDDMQVPQVALASDQQSHIKPDEVVDLADTGSAPPAPFRSTKQAHPSTKKRLAVKKPSTPHVRMAATPHPHTQMRMFLQQPAPSPKDLHLLAPAAKGEFVLPSFH